MEFRLKASGFMSLKKEVQKRDVVFSSYADTSLNINTDTCSIKNEVSLLDKHFKIPKFIPIDLDMLFFKSMPYMLYVYFR